MTDAEVTDLLKQCTPWPWRADGESVYGPPLLRVNKGDELPTKHMFNGANVVIVSDLSSKANSRKAERVANASLIVEAVRRLVASVDGEISNA